MLLGLGDIPLSKAVPERETDILQKSWSSHLRGPTPCGELSGIASPLRGILLWHKSNGYHQIVNMSKLVWTFDITTDSPVDTDVVSAYTEGFLTAPIQFPVTFTPRSAKHAAVIEREFEAAETFLAKYEN